MTPTAELAPLRWGVFLHAAGGACLHCGRPLALHAGGCATDGRAGSHMDGAPAR